MFPKFLTLTLSSILCLLGAALLTGCSDSEKAETVEDEIRGVENQLAGLQETIDGIRQRIPESISDTEALPASPLTDEERMLNETAASPAESTQTTPAEAAEKTPAAPTNSEYSSNVRRGDALLTAKRYSDAIAAYSEAIRINLEDAPAYYHRAVAYATFGQEKDIHRAIRDMTTYISIEQADPRGYLARSRLYSMIAMEGEAAADHMRAQWLAWNHQVDSH